MASNLLHSVKDRITNSEVLLRGTKPPVDVCRNLIAGYGSSTTTVTVNHLSLEFYTQTYEEVRHFWPVFGPKDELGDLLSELRPADTFYDVGAHVGMFTCFASKTVSEGQVVAFEPVSHNIHRLRENLRLNGISADIHSVALSDESKQLEMSLDSDKPGTIGHLSKSTAEESETITSVIGDDYIQENNITLPDVMKMDVEGAECKVLRGLEDSLSECRLIYSEASDQLQKYGDSEDELIEILQDLGFEIEYLSENDVIHSDLKATRDR